MGLRGNGDDLVGSEGGLRAKLGGTDDVGDELEVVQPPDSVRSGGFESISILKSPHHHQVQREDGYADLLFHLPLISFVAIKEAQSIEITHPSEEGKLVSTSIIDPNEATEPIHHILFQLDHKWMKMFGQ